jgi:hopanoid biosynthesis associated protein HpnK
MVSGSAADEAISLAHENPTLAIGLHLVVISGQPTLPPSKIPHLVDNHGCFLNTPITSGIRYFFNKSFRGELENEIRAQFEKFLSTGLKLSHVDGHLHMHLHPTVFSIILPMAKSFGAKGLRLPRDDPWLSLRYDPHRATLKLIWTILFGLLNRWCLTRLNGYSLATTDRVYGFLQSGQMQEAYVKRLLENINIPTAELYFHPDTAYQGNKLGPNPGDLATLLSLSIREIIHERGILLTTYPNLESEVREKTW